ncbi:MAG: molybdenum cofactor biosynthesis protein MoaE [Actinomycetota bacterium]|nr:molybdenum cofactor biosynthesis protein MoaE [Actinomycetota bacterium]
MTARVGRVITASTRAAAGVYADKTGPLIVAWLLARGYSVEPPVVVADGPPVEAALRAAVSAGVDVVITTGGTGITPTDRTPEATRAVLDYEIPGLADAIRDAGLPAVPTAVLSRGLAGVSGQTIVVNLPGSSGGVRDGLSVLKPVLDHAMNQVRGGAGAVTHPGAEPSGPAAVESPQVDDGRVGDGRVVLAAISDSPITVDEHADLVADAAAGAVVTFAGVVRDHDHGRSVTSLNYEGHPSAADVIAEVAAAVAARHAGVRTLAVSHRIGPLAIGDVALACAVSSEHRREAFVACAELVDEVKARLPIWKHQLFTDGTDEWVNCP